MENKYLEIISIIKSETKNGETNISRQTLRLIQFAKIKKKNIKSRSQTGTTQETAFLTSRLVKSASNQANKKTCTNSNCIKKKTHNSFFKNTLGSGQTIIYDKEKPKAPS